MRCNVCDKSFKHRRAVLRHKCLGLSFTCSVCKETMNNFRTYNEHNRNHYEEKNLFKCIECDFVNDNETVVRNHVTLHLEKKYADSFECEFCHKYFRHHEMFSHMRRHRIIKAFMQCTLCDEVFISDNFLLSHLEFVHSQYQCASCSYSTKTYENSIKHKSKAHAENVLFECKLCYFLYNCIYEFEVHAQNEHADHDRDLIIEYRDQIKCSVCGIQPRTIKTHNSHVQMHNKKYTCKICNLEMANLQELQKHECIKRNVYNERRDLVVLCKICDSPLSSKSSFFKHVNALHKEELKTQRAQDLYTEITFEQYGQTHTLNTDRNWLAKKLRLVLCVRCNTKVEHYRFNEHMKQHKVVHVCKVCLARLSSRHSFRSHVKKVHGEELKSKRIADLRKIVNEDELHRSEEMKIEPTDIVYESE